MATPALAYALPCPKCRAAAGERCVSLRDGSPLSHSHVRRSPLAPCGSDGGYQRHRKAGEAPCDACTEARRRVMQEYRKKNPDKRAADLAALRARNEAARILVARHREEFKAILAEMSGGVT